jgi:hypothetical protein
MSAVFPFALEATIIDFENSFYVSVSPVFDNNAYSIV